VELSWTTFLLEIVNFLALVWILKRFFYRPVLDVIARRREGIEKSLADAQAVRTQAEQLQQQYEGRIADWEREKQKARDDLARDIETQRTTRLAELEETLQRERDKASVADTRRKEDAVRKIEEAALLQGARFAARLLEKASGPELEKRLIDMVIDELADLSDERIDEIRTGFGEAPDAVVVTSAHAIGEERRREVEPAIRKLVEPETPIRFEQDPDLLAGIRIAVGAWLLGANVRDELKGFAELGRVE
jgi:F-type H+-transporting ATPase subunit b